MENAKRNFSTEDYTNEITAKGLEYARGVYSSLSDEKPMRANSVKVGSTVWVCKGAVSVKAVVTGFIPCYPVVLNTTAGQTRTVYASEEAATSVALKVMLSRWISEETARAVSDLEEEKARSYTDASKIDFLLGFPAAIAIEEEKGKMNVANMLRRKLASYEEALKEDGLYEEYVKIKG